MVRGSGRIGGPARVGTGMVGGDGNDAQNADSVPDHVDDGSTVTAHTPVVEEPLDGDRVVPLGHGALQGSRVAGIDDFLGEIERCYLRGDCKVDGVQESCDYVGSNHFLAILSSDK